jgi:nicotinamide-nucleotide adenylyltransferase
MKKQIGVILARFQPIHNGHIELIKKACHDNEHVFIFVGSADKINSRNPIPIDFRIELVQAALVEHSLDTYCTIVPLNDLDHEGNNSLTWGFYLYANIVREIQQDHFTIYYSDGFEIVTTWFTGYILRNHISLSLMARGSIASGISATQVRECILQNYNLIDLVPEIVRKNKTTIKSFILVSKDE